MRSTPTHAPRTLGALLLLGTAVACQPVSPRAPEPATSPTSMSDATLTPGKEATTYSRIEDLIQAKAPGVQVVKVEGGFRLRIRGLSSPQGSNDPLIVIDGVATNGTGNRALEAIDPNDVLRIEVLKDAASTSFYGMRGAYGVILVTTRKK